MFPVNSLVAIFDHDVALAHLDSKIRGFGELNPGWAFGEGEPASEISINNAIRIANYAARYFPANLDAVPDIDGAVTVAFGVPGAAIEVVAETDGTVSILQDTSGRLEISDGKTLDETIADLECIGFAQYRPRTPYQGKGNSPVVHLRPAGQLVFQLSNWTVLELVDSQFAST